MEEPFRLLAGSVPPPDLSMRSSVGPSRPTPSPVPERARSTSAAPRPSYSSRYLAERVQLRRLQSQTKLRSTWELIAEKYGSIPPEEDDEIDIFTGNIVVDRGRLRSIEPREFAAPQDGDDEEDEEDELFGGGRQLGPEDIRFGADEDELGDWDDRSGLDPQFWEPEQTPIPSREDMAELKEFLAANARMMASLTVGTLGSPSLPGNSPSLEADSSSAFDDRDASGARLTPRARGKARARVPSPTPSVSPPRSPPARHSILRTSRSLPNLKSALRPSATLDDLFTTPPPEAGPSRQRSLNRVRFHHEATIQKADGSVERSRLHLEGLAIADSPAKNASRKGKAKMLDDGSRQPSDARKKRSATPYQKPGGESDVRSVRPLRPRSLSASPSLEPVSSRTSTGRPSSSKHQKKLPPDSSTSQKQPRRGKQSTTERSGLSSPLSRLVARNPSPAEARSEAESAEMVQPAALDPRRQRAKSMAIIHAPDPGVNNASAVLVCTLCLQAGGQRTGNAIWCLGRESRDKCPYYGPSAQPEPYVHIEPVEGSADLSTPAMRRSALEPASAAAEASPDPADRSLPPPPRQMLQQRATSMPSLAQPPSTSAWRPEKGDSRYLRKVCTLNDVIRHCRACRKAGGQRGERSHWCKGAWRRAQCLHADDDAEYRASLDDGSASSANNSPQPAEFPARERDSILDNMAGASTSEGVPHMQSTPTPFDTDWENGAPVAPPLRPPTTYATPRALQSTVAEEETAHITPAGQSGQPKSTPHSGRPREARSASVFSSGHKVAWRCHVCAKAGGARAENAHLCRGRSRPHLCDPASAALEAAGLLEKPDPRTPVLSSGHKIVWRCKLCLRAGGERRNNAQYCRGRSRPHLCDPVAAARLAAEDDDSEDQSNDGFNQRAQDPDESSPQFETERLTPNSLASSPPLFPDRLGSDVPRSSPLVDGFIGTSVQRSAQRAHTTQPSNPTPPWSSSETMDFSPCPARAATVAFGALVTPPPSHTPDTANTITAKAFQQYRAPPSPRSDVPSSDPQLHSSSPMSPMSSPLTHSSTLTTRAADAGVNLGPAHSGRLSSWMVSDLGPSLSRSSATPVSAPSRLSQPSSMPPPPTPKAKNTPQSTPRKRRAKTFLEEYVPEEREIRFVTLAATPQRTRARSMSISRQFSPPPAHPASSPRKRSRVERIPQQISEDELEWGLDEEVGEDARQWRDASVVTIYND